MRRNKETFTYSPSQVVAILRQIRLKSNYEHEKVALDIAIQAMRDRDNYIDKQLNMCDNIGSLYKTHYERMQSDFEEGYNAAIRDALELLRKER